MSYTRASLVALEFERIKSKTKNQKNIFTNVMIGESLVEPTTLTFSLFEMGIQNDKSIGQAMRRLGFPFSQKPDGLPAFEMICGQVFVNLSAYLKAAVPSWPVDVALTDKIQFKFKPSLIYKWPIVAYQLGKILFGFRKFVLESDQEMQRLKAGLDAEISQNEKIHDLKSKLEHSLENSQKYFEIHVMTDFTFALIQGILKGLHNYLKLPYDINVWDPHYTEMALTKFHVDLWKTSQGKMSLDEFLNNHGNRSYKDWEIAAARYNEKPSELETLLASLKTKNNFEDLFKQQHEEKMRRWIEIKNQVQGKSSFLKSLYVSFGQSYKKIYTHRENSKSLCFHWIALFRQIVKRAQWEHKWSDDVYYLSITELVESFSSKKIDLARARERKKDTEILQAVSLPATFDSTVLPVGFSGNGTYLMSPNELVTLAPGLAEGEVFFIDSVKDCPFIQGHHIVVTKLADPQYVPYMIKAKGWILEQGSVLGHSSILARESGIPVISGFRNAGTTLEKGHRVYLDANSKEVKLVPNTIRKAE